jgi:mRNA-degrading endonuclease YafQ of YafQ-DinJ toxin-antitoxin module
VAAKHSLRVRTTKRFERAYRRYVGRDLVRRVNVDEALRRLAADMNDPRLKTHALSGELAGSHACSCGHNCRIVFTLEANPTGGRKEILLADVGTHDQIY